MKKLLLSAIVILSFSAVSFGQSTASASSTAILLTPISIEKTTDLNFGTLAASGTNGTVDIDYANVRTASTGVKLLAGSASEKTAVFTVTGEAGQSFAITIPDAASTIAMSGPSSGVVVTAFACQETNVSTLPSGTGSVTKLLHVKAQLKVPASAIAGTYQNTADLTVTVNYN